ncbi:hypothetical protein MMM139_13430 [Helicobacter pylori]
MFSPFWIKLLVLGILYIHWIFGMYLRHYSIKAFFFLSFGENFVIFLLLMLFVSFGSVGRLKSIFLKG